MLTAFEWKVGDRWLTNVDHTLVMGVLNVTPDSFSDGGAFLRCDAAVSRGLTMVAQGADIVDIGGESTRPGAPVVTIDEELARTIPVVASLAAEGVVVSIDTMKPEIAEAAMEAGALIINDISGLANPGMAQVAADKRAGLVLMHMQGVPATMQVAPTYADVVSEVEAYLDSAVAAALVAGVDRSSIAIDPGIGFGKTLTHNLELLAATTRLAQRGFPLLIGVSRKRFLGDLASIPAPKDRDAVSASLGAHLAAEGCGILRVHDVEATRASLRVIDAMLRLRP
jgi:dihydropteroate synthase